MINNLIRSPSNFICLYVSALVSTLFQMSSLIFTGLHLSRLICICVYLSQLVSTALYLSQFISTVLHLFLLVFTFLHFHWSPLLVEYSSHYTNLHLFILVSIDLYFSSSTSICLRPPSASIYLYQIHPSSSVHTSLH